MTSSKLRFMTRTALLLALTVVFQMVGRSLPNNNFIVGPLVNACLIVSTGLAGVWAGVIIAVAAPFTSLINNHAPVASLLLFFAPFIAVGNGIYVLAYYLLKKWNGAAGIAVGSLVKAGFLYAAIVVFLNHVNYPQQMETVVKQLFSWPQLITALVGGAVALVVVRILERHIEK